MPRDVRSGYRHFYLHPDIRDMFLFRSGDGFTYPSRFPSVGADRCCGSLSCFGHWYSTYAKSSVIACFRT